MTGKIFHIQGKVIDCENRQGIANLRVEAWDKDLLFDDLVGCAETDDQGTFQIQFDESHYRELFFDRHPDIFFRIFREHCLIGSTENSVLWNVKSKEIPIVIELDLEPVAKTWGWKLATSPDDALDFLNGTGAYEQPVSTARICALWKDDHSEFYIFYRRDAQPTPAKSWGWKLATDPDDVRDFLSGAGAYAQPVKYAQIAAFWRENHAEFYVFYQHPAPDEAVFANWGWKLATDPTDAMHFMNGSDAYFHPVTTARIAALEKQGHEEFYIFYQRAVDGEPVNNWRWKLTMDTGDAMNFVNGEGAYQHAVKGFEMAALWKDTSARFYIFANEGTRVWLQSPLHNERFVVGEAVPLRALLISEQVTDGNVLQWMSDLDGPLGQGADISVTQLSTGTHSITLTGDGIEYSRPIRVFSDLDDFYQAEPSSDEIARIERDFAINCIDGSGTEEQWSAYPEVFDQQSTNPSKLVVYAKLDVLRHQRFSEPLPFTAGKTIYAHFNAFVTTLNLRLDCAYNTGGGGQISLSRNLSVWDGRSSATATDPDACKKPFSNPTLAPYVSPLYLLIHEGRHSEPGDPGHIIVDGIQKDPYLENGSGHAWATMYNMWVYKYGLYDSTKIKIQAKQIAQTILNSRFPAKPTHSNAKVQAIIDELWQQ